MTDVPLDDEHACCVPVRRPDAAQVADTSSRGTLARVNGTHAIEQAAVPAQAFDMGDSSGDGNRGDGESPVREVAVRAFDIDATSVTNDAFALFAEATGYLTEAETFGYSAVFHLLVESDAELVIGPAAGTPWWYGVRGADWRHPGGNRSSIAGIGDHPVVHISWNDGVAYCAWAGRALPTEAQWECASRGGLDGARYPWGDDLAGHDGEFLANIWQGEFPSVNTADDGFVGTAPVRTFKPNAYGLWQTVGNVWEWSADAWDARSDDLRVLRGGSYLCHDSYCNRYRNSARSANTRDSSMGNAGFRTVSSPASDLSR